MIDAARSRFVEEMRAKNLAERDGEDRVVRSQRFGMAIRSFALQIALAIFEIALSAGSPHPAPAPNGIVVVVVAAFILSISTASLTAALLANRRGPLPCRTPPPFVEWLVPLVAIGLFCAGSYGAIAAASSPERCSIVIAVGVVAVAVGLALGASCRAFVPRFREVVR